MDEHSAPPPSRGEQLTIADVLQDPDPMGDLSRFAIEESSGMRLNKTATVPRSATRSRTSGLT